MSNWPTGLSGGATLSGVDTATSLPVVSFTSGINGAAAVWQEVFASVPFDADAITLRIMHLDTGYAVFDIGVGAAGSEIPVVENLLYASRQNRYVEFYLPLSITKGSRLCIAGTSANATAGTVSAQVLLHHRTGLLPRGAERIETINASRSTGRVLTIFQGPTTTLNTLGAWAELTPSMPRATRFVLAVLSIATTTTSNATITGALIDFAIGAPGSEQMLLSQVLAQFVRGNNTILNNFGPQYRIQIPLVVPQGARLSVRGQTTTIGATSRTMGVALYVA